MEKHFAIKIARASFAIAFLMVVFGTGMSLLPAGWKIARSGPVQQLPAVLRRKRPACFPHKHRFVDLNGGACRAIGRRMCNARLLYGNGYLGYKYTRDRSHIEPFVESTAAFSGLVRELGIPFLYVQAPCKLALERGQMPGGLVISNPNETALRVEAELAEHGVRTLDLVRVLVATWDDVEANFYRTDHHWRGRAAFKVAGIVARELADILDDPTLRDPPQLDIGNWTSRMKKRFFLGSHGRRTGRFFAGVDDFEYFVPKFETDIRRYELGKLQARGTFAKSVLDMSFLSRALHVRNVYGVYGVDKREVVYVNEKARSRTKVLFVKDSFANPVVDFLSTVCRQVIKVDPRMCASRDAILGIVRKHRPDIVVMLVNPSALGNDKYIWEEKRN